MKLRDYQQTAHDGLINHLLQDPASKPIIAMPTGCHAAGHPILMYDGSVKKVEDVAVGDELMGPDSKPRRVLALSRGIQEMRKVIPYKGESFTVNLDHKLLVHVTRQNYRHTCYAPRDEVITVRQFEEGSKTFRHIRKLKFAAINFPTKTPPLNPYLLGIILGDGCTRASTITVTTADWEVKQSIYGFCRINDLIMKIKKKPGNAAEGLTITDPQASRTKPNRVSKILTDLGVMGCRSWEKFIPVTYKTLNRENRLSLLAGLLDSDGYYSEKNNYFEFVTVSEQLAQDVKYLARSLGFSVRIIEKKTKRRLAYRLNLTGEINTIPTKIKRKKAKKPTPNKHCGITGFRVEKLPADNYYGFTLDGDHLYVDGNFVIHHNTGKSFVVGGLIKTFVQEWSARVVMATHVKELLVQNGEALNNLWNNAPLGYYSAGLRKKDTDMPIIFGGMASLRNKAGQLGWRDALLVDECHLISRKESSSYHRIIASLREINPDMKVIGLSATPFRSKEGSLLIDGGIFNNIAVDMTSIEWFSWFIREGYLVKLVTRPTKNVIDVSGVGLSGGDFKAGELAEISGDERKLHACIEEMCLRAADRNTWIIFAAGNANSDKTAEILDSYGVSAASVHSGMSDGERDARISDYKNGRITCLVNNNICTTGFDHRPIDFIGMLRATMSTGLWVQMLGRGTRPSPDTGKEDCLALDFVGNARRLGPINDPKVPNPRGKKTPGDAPVKICHECGTYNHPIVRFCDYCGHEFSFQSKLTDEPFDGELIRIDEPIYERFEIKTVNYYRHDKKDSPPQIRVQYVCANGLQSFDEFVGLEHEGYKCKWSRDWWRARFPNSHVPDTTSEALQAMSMMRLSNSLRTPRAITVHVNRKYPEIKHYEY